MTEKCLEIEDVLEFESLEACNGKKVAFGWQGQPYKSPKFKFSVSGKKNVRLFGVMTKTSVLSEKNVPLKINKIRFYGHEHFLFIVTRKNRIYYFITINMAFQAG